MKALFSGLLFFLSTSVFAHGLGGIMIGGELEDEEYTNQIFELNYVGRIDPHITIYGGYAWMKLGFKENYYFKETQSFHGTQAGLLMHPRSDWIRPYVGLGLYAGEGRYCDSRYYCGYESVFAIYPEAGVQVSLGEHLQLSGKVRWYEFDRTEIKDETMYLMSVSFYF